MGDVRLDPSVNFWRALVFPFFDPIEIGFSVAVIAAETVFFSLVHIPNGWVVPIGSYMGLLAVAWTVLPSRLDVALNEVSAYRQAASALNMKQVLPERFVANLPALLRWPRNAVEFRGTTLLGPRSLLFDLRQAVVCKLL